MVAMATTRYCNGVDHILEHILLVVFVTSRVDSPMFARTSVLSIGGTLLYHRAVSETLSLFLGGDMSEN